MGKNKKPFDAGKKLFSWTAHDYHPHERGMVWHVVFCAVFFGGAAWAAITDPKWGWITAFSLCAIAAIYLFTHREGAQDHAVEIYDKGLFIDQSHFLYWDKFEQFWFVYDQDVSVINFDLKKKRPTH